MVSILTWAFSAPDYRFACGSLVSIALLTLVLFIDNNKERCLAKAGNITLLLFTIAMIVLSAKRTHNFHAYLITFSDKEDTKALSSIINTPYSTVDQAKRCGFYPNYLPYKMDSVTVFVSSDLNGRCYDKFPAVASDEALTKKFQPISSIEVRGSSLQDGFRSKK